MRCVRTVCVLALLLAPTLARAQTPPPTAPPPLEDEAPPADEVEVVIEGEKPASEAASRISVSRRELELRPSLRAATLAEAVPGMFVAQHAGGGKANQYFLRGFDVDHGTDVAFFVDGVPVNMVSHGHGQGYTDLGFVIPELVVGLDGYKGPYYASLGDFATAGAVDMHLAETFEESRAQASVGQHGILRALVIESPDLGEDWRAVAAAEIYRADGPFDNPEKHNRYNVYLRAAHDLGKASKVSIGWMSYGSTWRGSGQIPARAVCGEGEAGAPRPEDFGADCIDRFGYVDPTEGGATQRHQATLGLQTTWRELELSASAYFVKYRFALYSNFGFFADDPVNGDQIEQGDNRVLGGLDLRVSKPLVHAQSRFKTSFGIQTRVDAIDNALYHDVARERIEDRVDASVDESQIGVWVEEDARLTPWLRFLLGLRAQRIDVAVEDRLEDKSGTGTKSSGQAGATLLLPKLMAVVSPIAQLDLFAAGGRGFHSNDARGAVLGSDRVTLMTPAVGAEVGARGRPIEGLELHATGFVLDLRSELVWIGDEGTTEASGQTRRLGLEVGGRFRLQDWLFADIDATFTRARFNDGSEVPLAPRRTLSAGVGVKRRIGDWTPFASVRVKSIADRPAIEDESIVAEGFTILDAEAGARWRFLEVGVEAQNIFDASWREAQFASTSRLPYEPAPVTGIHYAPGWPRTIVGRAAVYW